MSMSAQDMHHHDNGTTNQNFSITVNTCGINTCPPATVTITPTGLNAMWVNQGASDPYTFYYGLVNAKRLNAKIVGGVGPFAYNWSNSGTGTLLPRMYYPDQSIDLLEPTAATTISVTVTDLSNMCQYMGTIAINVDDSYFCGKTGNTWNILICEGGITKCVDWNTGRNKIRAHTATLGSCGGLKQNVSTTATAAMLVYPNPSNGVITIQFSASSYAKGSIVVVDMHGRTLLQNETDFVMGVQERQLDMTHFANGIYLIKVISGDDVKTEKIQILK